MKTRIPSWLWRIVLQSTTETLGEKGTHTILRRSGLQNFVGVTPEDDDSPSVAVTEFSEYIEALFDIFGEEGARPVMLRAGKTGFVSAYDRMPPVIKLASKMLRFIPEKKRVEKVVSEFNKAFNETLGTTGVTMQAHGKTIVELPDCPYCRGVSTKAPACYVEIGLLSELLKTSVGEGYVVQETQCKAMGDSVCRFEIRSDADEE
jgi:bacteriochlorophyll 4-vinyl reductase